MSKSSRKRASQLRLKGDGFVNSNQFPEALLCYNESLCHSESNEEKALTYSRRAEIYLKTGNWQHCLENIKLSRDHQKEEKKITSVDELEVKCQNLMKPTNEEAKDNPGNFFKLSYPANKNIPFIADCLELKKDSTFGRYVVTNRDLKPGDFVAIEDSFFKHLKKDQCYKRCRQCLTANMYNLIPCPGRCVDSKFRSFVTSSFDSYFSFPFSSISDVLFREMSH